MTKHDYLTDLRLRLQQLPPEEVHRLIHYYAEFIDDAMECGHTEHAAVASLPAPAVVAASALEGGSGADASAGSGMDGGYYNRQESSAGFYGGGSPSYTYNGGFPPHGVSAPPVTHHASQPPVPPPVQPPAPPSAPDAGAAKKGNAGALTAKITGLFFYSAIIMPLVFSAAVTLLAVWFAFFTAAASILISGLAVIVYGFIAGGAGHSFMLFFTFLAAGLILSGIGALCVLGMKTVSRPVFKAVGKLFKAAVKIYKA